MPPIELTEAMIKPIRESMPVMPGEWRERLAGLGMDLSQTDTLLEAEVEDESIAYLSLIQELLEKPEEAKAIANWMVNLEIPLRREKPELKAPANRSDIYQKVYQLVKASKLSSTNAKALFTLLFESKEPVDDIEAFAKQHDLIQVSDSGAIEKIVQDVLAANPAAAEDVKNGEMKAIGFLVGQVMKESKGQANPQMAQELVKKQLGV